MQELNGSTPCIREGNSIENDCLVSERKQSWSEKLVGESGRIIGRPFDGHRIKFIGM